MLLVLGVFACLFVLLAFQEGCARRVEAPGTIEYLLRAGGGEVDDPLGIASPELEPLGVSNGGRTVGYVSSKEVPQAMASLDEAMRANGWLPLSMDAQGIASYVWQGAPAEAETPRDAAFSPGVGVLFICTAHNSGCSLVAEFF
ncbi:MAG: hypothetical protein LBH56_02565 [Coriobacteriales bacterium]|jgi:hypothetical protein|nr:hypothetical protein [Coriobacteriales bacterium]